MQIGHRMPGYTITEIDAAESPDYPENTVVTIDKLLRLSIRQAHHQYQVADD